MSENKGPISTAVIHEGLDTLRQLKETIEGSIMIDIRDFEKRSGLRVAALEYGYLKKGPAPSGGTLYEKSVKLVIDHKLGPDGSTRETHKLGDDFDG